MGKLKELRLDNPKYILFDYLIINSIRTKFENLCSLLADKFDILNINEIKPDGSFQTNQFFVKGFHQPFWLDINRNSGELLMYIKSSLPAKIISNDTVPSDIEAIPFELNRKKGKCLFFSIYKPPSQNSHYFLNSVSDMLNYYSNHYENKVIFGDFNMNTVKPEMNIFLSWDNITNLIKENTCLKEACSCIDLIVTNSNYLFQNSLSVETDFSDHHQLALEEPKGVVYHNFKSFNNDYLEEELSSKVDLNNKDQAVFEDNYINVLNRHAPKNTKIFRSNHKLHASKTLRLAIMKLTGN